MDEEVHQRCPAPPPPGSRTPSTVTTDVGDDAKIPWPSPDMVTTVRYDSTAETVSLFLF